ncbi:hypothetical protein [Streptomyces sp. CA-111067]
MEQPTTSRTTAVVPASSDAQDGDPTAHADICPRAPAGCNP